MQEDNSFEALINPGEASNFFHFEEAPVFNPVAAKSYSRDNGLWLMECCRLVYRKDRPPDEQPKQPSRQEIFDHFGLKETRFFDGHVQERNIKDAQAALIKGKGFVVLAFRGTLGAGDLLADLDFKPTDWGGEGKVHEGFKKQFDAIWEQGDNLRAALDELKEEDGPVFYTGHSLGASLATLAAATRFLDEKAVKPAALYTFGSPRAGTRGFAHAFPDDFFHCRVVNDRDFVPTVPPRKFLLTPDFHHVGIPHHIDHVGHLRRGKPGDDEDGFATPKGQVLDHLNSLSGRFLEFVRTAGRSFAEKFTDHTPVNYTARIERAGDFV